MSNDDHVNWNHILFMLFMCRRCGFIALNFLGRKLPLRSVRLEAEIAKTLHCTYCMFIAAQSANASTQKKSNSSQKMPIYNPLKEQWAVKAEGVRHRRIRVIIPLQDISRSNMASATFVVGVCYVYMCVLQVGIIKHFTHIIQNPLIQFLIFPWQKATKKPPRLVQFTQHAYCVRTGVEGVLKAPLYEQG